MSIYATPGGTFTAVLQDATPGLTGTLGVRIENSDGTNQTARTTAGIVELEASSGTYAKANLVAPTTAGTYVVLWDTGGGSPQYATEELVVTSTAPSPALPSGSDLTTLASVRAYLQKDTSDTAQDSLIQTIITRASKAIHTFAQREFTPAATATRLFHWHGGPLHLAPYDLRTVTSIRVNTDTASPSTLATTGYRLRPKPARDGVYRWIDLVDYDISPDRRLTAGDPIWEVEIVGAWGFATVPEDVAHWANVTVDTWLRREVQAFGSTFGSPDAEQLERPESLPLDVRKGLAHYRIVGAG